MHRYSSDACKDKQQGLQPDQLQNVSDHQLQFLGGGFNLSRAPPPSRLSGASGTEGGTLWEMQEKCSAAQKLVES